MKRTKHPSELPFDLYPVETPTGYRAERLEHLLFEEVDRLFRFEVIDPRLESVTIVSLQLSPDYRNARVKYALDEEELIQPTVQQLRAGFAKVSGFLRARVAEQLGLKRVPMFSFQRDRTAEASLRAQALMNAPQEPNP